MELENIEFSFNKYFRTSKSKTIEELKKDLLQFIDPKEDHNILILTELLFKQFNDRDIIDNILISKIFENLYNFVKTYNKDGVYIKCKYFSNNVIKIEISLSDIGEYTYIYKFSTNKNYDYIDIRIGSEYINDKLNNLEDGFFTAINFVNNSWIISQYDTDQDLIFLYKLDNKWYKVKNNSDLTDYFNTNNELACIVYINNGLVNFSNSYLSEHDKSNIKQLIFI